MQDWIVVKLDRKDLDRKSRENAIQWLVDRAISQARQRLHGKEYKDRGPGDSDCQVAGIAESLAPAPLRDSDLAAFNALQQADKAVARDYEARKVRGHHKEAARNLRHALWTRSASSSNAYNHKRPGLEALIKTVENLLDEPQEVGELLAHLKLLGRDVHPRSVVHPEEVSTPGSETILIQGARQVTSYQHPDNRLLKTAHRLAADIAAELIKQESNHQISGPAVRAVLPVKWTVVQDKRADPWEYIQLETTHVQPSMLNGEFPHILQTFNLVDSKRLVILGNAGSGKTIVASHLALELAKQLPELPANEQPLIPVIVGLASWSNRDIDFQPWIIAQLAERHLSEHYVNRDS